jgi:NAD-dependent dihydropyrimidine dehydrogenase PreA subunit
MTVRNIVKIDEAKCNGCGLCVNACAEGAIKIIDGKAKLVSEIYCDGLGACLGHCPQNAITVEKREAAAFDETAVKTHLAKEAKPAPVEFVCPGMMAHNLREKSKPTRSAGDSAPSQLTHWPVQLSLISPQAACFKNADLLLVADCVPFAMGDFHSRFLSGRSVAVGCPKLDDKDFYVEKLAEILKSNELNSLTVIHMEVPCCWGLTAIAQKALALSGRKLAITDVTIALDGSIKKTETL